MNFKKIIKRLIAYPARELYRLTEQTNENLICFESSPDYADNSWALFKYMVDHGYNQKYQLYWIADRKDEKINGLKNVNVVLRDNYIQVVKLVYSAKFIFYTHGLSCLVREKEGQYIINLWHGCGYKASRTKDINGRFSLKRLLLSSRLVFDYVLVPGNAFIKTKSEFFNCDESKILPLGYPRYDLLFSSCSRWLALKEAWGINDNKFVIWMPTYRKTGDNSYKENGMTNQYWLPLLHNDEELRMMNDYCVLNHIKLVVKKHRLQSQFIKDSSLFSNIIFIDDSDLEKCHVQLYEILQFSDALVTDYSSIAIDYLLLDKPIAFTLDDYEEYASKRGFVFTDAKKYMPGHHIFKLDDMNSFFVDIKNGTDPYRDKREELLPILQNKCDGYSKRVLDYFNIAV